MFISAFKTPGLEDLDGGLDGNEEGEGATFVDEAPEEDIHVDEEPEDEVVDVDDLDAEVEGTERLGLEIEHLMNLAGAIEQYGISPGMMAVADRDGLLSSTFHVIPATESMAGPYRPESATSVAALEGVISAAKSKVAEYAAKAGSLATSLATKGFGLLKSLVGGAAHLASTVASKTWNAVKATGAMIKAHPYKTAAIVIAAIAAVAGVFGLMAAFPTSAAAVTGWFTRIRTALTSIKFPTGSIKTAFTSQGKLNAAWVSEANYMGLMGQAGPMVARPLNALGWTKAAVMGAPKSLGAALSSVMAALAKIPGALRRAPGLVMAAGKALPGGIGNKVGEAAWKVAVASANHPKLVGTATSFAGMALVGFVIKLVWMLLKNVVLSGYRMVKSMVTRVSTVAETGGTEEAPA